MTEDDIRKLIDDIDTTVRAIPGVTGLFSPRGAGAKLVDAGARMLGIRPDDTSLIHLEQTEDGARVEVAIGVQAAAGAVETSCRVQAEIRALCAEQHVVLSEIHVTVVHIDDTSHGKGAHR